MHLAWLLRALTVPCARPCWFTLLANMLYVVRLVVYWKHMCLHRHTLVQLAPERAGRGLSRFDRVWWHHTQHLPCAGARWGSLHQSACLRRVERSLSPYKWLYESQHCSDLFVSPRAGMQWGSVRQSARRG